MPEYRLTYARCVLLTRTIKARSQRQAEEIAIQMERDGDLGLEDVEAKKGSEIEDIQDEDTVWEIERI
jgi:hypothetical protein